MAKRKASQTEASAASSQPQAQDKRNEVLIDTGSGFDTVAVKDPRQLFIYINGERYVHVSTTPAGQWVYRAS